MKLSRRDAIGQSLTAAAAVSLTSRIEAADSASGLKGHINHSVCRWCYGKVPLDELCRASKEMGIQSVELLKVDEIPTAKKFGLTCAMVTGVPGGIEFGLNRIENHDKIVEFYEATAPQVVNLGCKNIICFSGNRKGQADEQGLENCAIGIKRLLPICERHNVLAVMELLNSKVDHKDYQCDRSPWGVELCKRVGSERFKLLYDIYHMQIMEGDVVATIRKFHPYFAHYHTGGVPGRHEIDETQELNYPAVMRAIVESKFTGHVAQEFIPARPDVLASLKQGVNICDV